jgi:hypothetical protein
MGNGYLEVTERGCLQLSPTVLKVGDSFVVATSLVDWIADTELWVAAGGPWPDTKANRADVIDSLEANPKLSEL